MADHKAPAIILGLSETGLAIVHSLAEHQIEMVGVSHSLEIGSFSKFIRFRKLPHPLEGRADFKESLKEISGSYNQKPVLFIAADEYLQFYIKESGFVHDHFQINIASPELLERINDKAKLYELAIQSNIPVPKTVLVKTLADLDKEHSELVYPVFVKAQNPVLWRTKISGSTKGFVAKHEEELREILQKPISNQVPVLIQEIIQSSDRDNVKFCVNMDDQGRFLQTFMLRKIHQYPIHFGIASSAESFHSSELEEVGKRLFSAIGYSGIGSAEFKLDDRTSTFKLVEINTRFWQQNYLSTKCGMNFALNHYLASTGQKVDESSQYQTGIKWVNYHLAYQSFLQYRKIGELNFRQWRKDIKGPKTISLYNKKDLKPFRKHLKRILLKKIVKIIKRI